MYNIFYQWTVFFIIYIYIYYSMYKKNVNSLPQSVLYLVSLVLELQMEA